MVLMSISTVSTVTFPKERRHLDCGGPVVREALVLELELELEQKCGGNANEKY